MNYDLTIILPTLNEAANIRTIINSIIDVTDKHNIITEILVVDDNSTDGTHDIIRDISAVYPRVHMLVRLQDHGLSSSVVDGFLYAAAPRVIVMDADGQHPVSAIPLMYDAMMNGADIVIGSRYMEGGEIEQWSLERRIISKGATFIARLLFPLVTDPVSGFFGLWKTVVQRADIHPRGYKILLEVLGKGDYGTITEIPFTFAARETGSSKLKAGTMVEYITEIGSIVLHSIFERDLPCHREIARVCKFMTVGVSGIIVNMLVLSSLYEVVGIELFFSSVIATEISVLTNFALNNMWTFKEVPAELSWSRRLVLFNIVSLGGILITAMTLFVLVKYGMFYLFANLIGILLAFSWNFLVNKNITWKVGK